MRTQGLPSLEATGFDVRYNDHIDPHSHLTSTANLLVVSRYSSCHWGMLDMIL
jgi:hypothetical protein